MKVLKTLAGIMSLGSMLIFTGCSAGDEPGGFIEKDPIVPDAEMNVYLDAQRDAAWDVYAKVVEEEKDRNLAFSPMSLYVALAMTSLGAPDECMDELGEFFHYPVSPKFHDYNHQILSVLPYLDNQTKFKLANSIWVKAQYSLNPTFTNDAKVKYFGDAQIVNPGEDMNSLINDWISENTDGLIKSHLDDEPEYALMLVNALYFKSKWDNPFEKANTKNSTFHHADGSKKEVPFMNGAIECKHGYFDGGEVLTIPFRNKKFNISFYLPSEIIDTKSFIKKCDLRTVRNSLSKTRLEVSLPKFETTTSFDLIPVLKKLGVRELFKLHKWPIF